MDKNITHAHLGGHMNFFHQYHHETQILHNRKLDFPPHLHNEVEIIVLFQGEAAVTVNEKHYRLAEGDFLIVFPNTIHSYFTESAVDVGKFIFPPETIPELGSVFKNKYPLCPVISREKADSAKLSALATEIIDTYEGSAPLVRRAFLTLLTAKLIELCELAEMQKFDHNTLNAVFEFCQKNFRQNITQEAAAEALHISKSHLSHIFCVKMKINFRNYINTLRTNEACRLILQSDRSMTDISNECGFSSIRSFNRAFIKNVGMTPIQYRRSFADQTADRFWNNRFYLS